jgi:hypothetical protein
MSGLIIMAVPKRVVSFANLPVSTTQELVLADRIDLVDWRELTLILNVHGHSLGGTTNTIGIRAISQSWTAEDPKLEFLGDIFSVNIDSDTLIPELRFIPIAPFGYGGGVISAMARITALGTRGVNPGAMDATVSVQISAKDGSP